VALGAGWEPLLGEQLAMLVNGDGGVAVFVRVNPIRTRMDHLCRGG
jgi:hypothetical protein